ncbi:MAG: substrate-binding domain-containing protein [Bacteroidota bacterium]|nr:substrate-binding domain-containing protein [Bacteroidota bacterium]
MKKSIYFISLYLLLLASCKTKQDAGFVETDTPKKGTIYISVDESFKPVIEQQIKVYHSSYPEANIIASYKPEVECFKDFMKDSTRLIIVAKGLSKSETSFFANKLSVPPQFATLAYDAVAVIVNIKSKDSVFTIADLKNILTGKKNITAIMDGNNATSSVRYLQDSVLRGASFGKNVVAVNGSDAVIEAIKKTENAIGFVGLSWVGNSEEPQQVEDLKKMRLALVECVKCNEKDMFAKPSQATITFGEYPLARPLYYIFKDDAGGLGTGFVNFMSLERGQLIFRRSGLAPAKMSFLKRNSKIKEQE